MTWHTERTQQTEDQMITAIQQQTRKTAIQSQIKTKDWKDLPCPTCGEEGIFPTHGLSHTCKPIRDAMDSARQEAIRRIRQYSGQELKGKDLMMQLGLPYSG